jgi:hypothetical protein
MFKKHPWQYYNIQNQISDLPKLNCGAGMEDPACDTLRYLCMSRPVISYIQTSENPAENWKRNLETKHIIAGVLKRNKKLFAK